MSLPRLPLDWMGRFPGEISLVGPPTYDMFMDGSVFFRFSWTTGFLWWKKKREETIEFYQKGVTMYWPGPEFKEVDVTLWIQLINAGKAAVAKKTALEEAGL